MKGTVTICSRSTRDEVYMMVVMSVRSVDMWSSIRVRTHDGMARQITLIVEITRPIRSSSNVWITHNGRSSTVVDSRHRDTTSRTHRGSFQMLKLVVELTNERGDHIDIRFLKFGERTCSNRYLAVQILRYSAAKMFNKDSIGHYLINGTTSQFIESFYEFFYGLVGDHGDVN